MEPSAYRKLAEKLDMNFTGMPKRGSDFSPAFLEYLGLLYTPDCIACGTCIERCFFNAISIPDDSERARVDEERCMGCGVCTVTCANEAIRLERYEREAIFPNTAELHARMALENEVAGQKRSLRPGRPTHHALARKNSCQRDKR